MLAATSAERHKVVAAMQNLALRDVPTVPLGRFYIHIGYRTSLAGHVCRRPQQFPGASIAFS
jgi:hypothetical protein